MIHSVNKSFSFWPTFSHSRWHRGKQCHTFHGSYKFDFCHSSVSWSIFARYRRYDRDFTFITLLSNTQESTKKREGRKNGKLLNLHLWFLNKFSKEWVEILLFTYWDKRNVSKTGLATDLMWYHKQYPNSAVFWKIIYNVFLYQFCLVHVMDVMKLNSQSSFARVSTPLYWVWINNTKQVTLCEIDGNRMSNVLISWELWLLTTTGTPFTNMD